MDYEASVNALIPKAEQEANRIIGLTGQKTETRPGVDGLPYTWDYFTEHFFKAMNRMASEAGLR